MEKTKFKEKAYHDGSPEESSGFLGDGKELCIFLDLYSRREEAKLVEEGQKREFEKIFLKVPLRANVSTYLLLCQ